MKQSLLCLSLFILIFSSCKKLPPPPTPETYAMFWIDSDFGCGPITVTCNGQSKVINGYYSSQPSCNASSAATFNLPGGTYSFTARCSSKTWSGNISVVAGQCNAYKLTVTGGSTGGGSTNPATVTTPSTMFIASQDYTVSSNGTYWTQAFTLTTTTKFVLRFTSQYAAQASIIPSTQLSNFQSGATFTGYATFNNQVGTNYVTLGPGNYYMAVRNTSSGSNKWSLELDYAISLPSSDRSVFVDNYISGSKSFSTPSRYWQPFTIQSGYRYFLDGCNVNCDIRLIPADQLAAFQNNQTYQYFTSYYSSGGGEPGLYEIKLPPGNYYIVSYNSTAGALTYVMERWKVN